MSDRDSIKTRIAIALSSMAVGAMMGIAATVYVFNYVGANDVVLRFKNDNTMAAKLEGAWKLKDLRVANSQMMPIAFQSDGVLEHDPGLWKEQRWYCNGGLLYMASRHKNEFLKNDPYVFAVVPTFDEATGDVVLAFPGEQPHARLVRDK